MTILFFSRVFYPHIGGVEKHVLEIGKILIKKGHQVLVFTEQFESKLKLQDNIDGIEIYRISVGKDNWFKKFRVWRQLWKYRKFIKTADIIHAHDVFFWYLPFRFLYPNKPVYTTFHGYEGNNLPSKRAIFMHKLAEKLSKGNICVGDFLKKWYGTKPDYVIYGGVDVKKILNSNTEIRNKFKIQNSKFKILLVGRLEKDLGISIYLQSLQILRKKKIEFQFEACGDGSLKQDVEKYGKVYGFVEDLGYYISKADIVFASSYLSIFEAMANKRLVFAVFGNSLKQDYLKMSPFAKWIVIESSSEKLASKIEYFMNHHEEKKKTIDDGYQWVSKQTWQKVVEIYLKLWHSNDTYH